MNQRCSLFPRGAVLGFFCCYAGLSLQSLLLYKALSLCLSVSLSLSFLVLFFCVHNIPTRYTSCFSPPRLPVVTQFSLAGTPTPPLSAPIRTGIPTGRPTGQLHQLVLHRFGPLLVARLGDIYIYIYQAQASCQSREQNIYGLRMEDSSKRGSERQEWLYGMRACTACQAEMERSESPGIEARRTFVQEIEREKGGV